MEQFPRILTDIGGTNARFCLEITKNNFTQMLTLSCNDFEDLSAAIAHYLTIIAIQSVKHAVIALPTPVVDDTILMVNSPWKNFSIIETKNKIAIENIIFLNDFHALALATPFIDKNNLFQVGGLIANPNSPITIIGPGTGLGMAGLIKDSSGNYLAIAAEGGRSSFTAVNEEEFEIWQYIHKRFNHVSVERLVSGPGLQIIYEALCNKQNKLIKQLPTPQEISANAIDNSCWICKQTLDHFCRMLGTMASNLAVIFNSFGGVYIGGGIIPQILDYFINSDFRCRFEDKGRYRPYLAKIPVYVILQQYPAFLGCSYAMDKYLKM